MVLFIEYIQDSNVAYSSLNICIMSKVFIRTFIKYCIFFGLFQLKCGIHWQSYVPYDYYHTPHRLYCSNKFISEISEASRQAALVNRQDMKRWLCSLAYIIEHMLFAFPASMCVALNRNVCMYMCIHGILNAHTHLVCYYIWN